MRFNPLIAIAAVLLTGHVATIAAPGLKEDKDSLKKFEGNWTFTAWENYGRALPEQSRATAKWSVKGDKYTFEISGVEEEGTIAIDATKKPATFDLTITSGNDKGKTQLGIYKIDGDTIVMCLARPGVETRPTEFSTTEENEHILVTIKKEKAK